MAMMVMKAGTAISSRFHSISPMTETISTPTMMSAGAVTLAVTTLRSGEKNNDKANRPATTTAVNPVLAPEATPAVDSTNAVVGEVPIMEAKTMEDESASSAGPTRFIRLSLIRPALVAI